MCEGGEHIADDMCVCAIHSVQLSCTASTGLLQIIWHRSELLQVSEKRSGSEEYHIGRLIEEIGTAHSSSSCMSVGKRRSVPRRLQNN